MRSKAKVIGLVLTAVIAVGACKRDFRVERKGNGIEIAKYTGSKTAVNIPLRIQGRPVTGIGRNAFWDCTSLTSVTIPYGVTSIGDNAFAFCASLTSVTIPNSVTSISKYAFGDCTSLTSITIPNSVTTIGAETFWSCASLASVTIPNSVTSIWSSAFNACTSLTAINVDSGNATYSSDNGVLYNKAKTTLIGYPSGKTAASFTIPDSVTSIGKYAFYGCASLTSVTIPNSVTSIEQQAFRDCASLAGVTIPDSVTTIGWGAFIYCDSLASVTIPDSVTYIEGNAFASCTSLASVTFQGTIASRGFSNNSSYPVFPGDLRDKYLAADGGIGTYTRPDDESEIWTKQP